MGSRSAFVAGMEVPILGIDSIKWIDVHVPAASRPTISQPSAPLLEDTASCSIVGDPPTYLIWRIHKTKPSMLELMEFTAFNEFPRIGLRILFHDALRPFAFICKNEICSTSGNRYLLYALTISGVAYVLKLEDIASYKSCSIFPQNDLIEFDMQPYTNHEAITAVAATAGCLAVGRNDGSVCCFRLGIVDQNDPAFIHELRDEAGIGRLWGLVSRNRTPEPVQDIAIFEVQRKQLAIVLHLHGTLQVWDLPSRNRAFSCMLRAATSTGAMYVKFWVGEANHSRGVIPLAILCRDNMEVGMKTIYVFLLRFSMGDKMNFLLEPLLRKISLGEERLVDVKLSSSKMWILKEDGLILHNLFGTDVDVEGANRYTLQEAFVADQLFQSSKYSADELLQITHSVFSSSMDRAVPFLSSIFLRRLLHPGVYHPNVLYAALHDCNLNLHLADSEFKSLTVDGVKKEITSRLKHEGVDESPTSIFYGWKNLCARYFHYWCKGNSPCALLLDSLAGTVGLIRKNSISLFRDLEDFELLNCSSFEYSDLLSSRLDIFHDICEDQILCEIFHCISHINQKIGKAASAILCESFVGEEIISYEGILPRFLKVLESGYSPSVASFRILDLGTDNAWEKELTDHKTMRRFSVDVFLSLHALYNKASTWTRVLDVVESYIKYLVPRKIVHESHSEVTYSVNTSIMVQSTCQVANALFESTVNVLLFLNYILRTSGQIHMSHDNISRIQLILIPMTRELVSEWLIIHFLGTTPSESRIEDFSLQLSSLKIDGNSDKGCWNEKVGNCSFTLAFILLLDNQNSSADLANVSLTHLPNPCEFISSVWGFISWINSANNGEESPPFLSHYMELALILLRHHQYDAAENLLSIVGAHLGMVNTSGSSQECDSNWPMLLHLLGCCHLARAQYRFHGKMREKKVGDAINCFFRASFAQGASKALGKLPHDAGVGHFGFTDCISPAAWKLHYYQWVMQIFEQYSMNGGACQFALAAIEQVDEAFDSKDESFGKTGFKESPTTVKGRLWANVFKFALDNKCFYDAYCAIITNPDIESQYICLRRFIIVLCEHGDVKILCDGQLPFVYLTEKVEEELSWKAGLSDVSAKPNPYKLLYAFEIHHHNWRKAAAYMYLYSDQLRTEGALKDYLYRSTLLQERLNGLSAAINALQLVHHENAWFGVPSVRNSPYSEHYPSKKSRRSVVEKSSASSIQPERPQSYVDIKKLEKEFLLTSAEYFLSLEDVKWNCTDVGKHPTDLVDLLVQNNLYDMAFTVILGFWNGSALQREMEKVFVDIALKCCAAKGDPLAIGEDFRTDSLMLTTTKHELVHTSMDLCPSTQQLKGNNLWGTLEHYLEKYKAFHERLPIIVAETLLRSDVQNELPLWLVSLLKGNSKQNWGISSQESSPMSLFQLYVDYGRLAEATNLLLEHIESFRSMRPADVIRRKRSSAIWLPYTRIEHLLCQLDESISRGHMVDHHEKLKRLLHGALRGHLKLVKADSDDAVSLAY